MSRLINDELLKESIRKKTLFNKWECVLIDVVIDDQPTVDAVPVVHGRWTRENSYGTWKCSECGCKVNRANPLKGNIWNYYYCPNCGADMRG